MSDQTVIDVSAQQDRLAFFSPNDDRLSSFASGVSMTFAARVLVLAGSVGASIIVGRWLGPEGLGALAVLNVTVALALQLGSVGLPSATIYFIAKDRPIVGQAWANAIMFAVAAGGSLTAAVLLLARFKPDVFSGVEPHLVAIVAISIPFQLLTLLGLNVFLAMDKLALMNALDALSSALILLNAILVLVLMGGKLETLVSFNTTAAAFVSLLILTCVGFLVRKARRRVRPDLALLKQMLAYGLKFYVSIVASFVIFRADLLIVNRLRSPSEAGVYAVAAQLSLLLMMLPGVIATLLFPRVAARQDDAGEYAAEVTRHASFMMLIICLGAGVLSLALPFIYGVSFSDATIQLLIILPGILLVSIESVLVQHFTGTGLPAAIPFFWIVTMVFNLGLNFALIPLWGARAAALNSTLSYALIFLLVTIYFCSQTGRPPLEIFVLRKRELRDLFAKLSSRAFARS